MKWKPLICLSVAAAVLSGTVCAADYLTEGCGGSYANGSIYTMPQVTEASRTFTHDGYTYILLKQGETDSFIYAEDTYGKITSLSPPETSKLDPAAEGSLLHWLNNDFLTGGAKAELEGRQIDDGIKDYLVEKIWNTEQSKATEELPYSFHAKLSLISVSELTEYGKWIGYKPKDHRGGKTRKMILTRTPQSGVDNKLLYYWTDSGAISNTGITTGGYGNFYIRPCFYLSNDFFKNTRLNVDTLGSDIKKILLDIGYSTLAKVYSQEELYEIGFDECKTVIANGRMAGKASVGNQISVSFDTYNLQADTEFLYSWSRGDSPVGNFEVIAGEADKSYVLRDGDNEKYIKCTVTYNEDTESTSEFSVVSDMVTKKNYASARVDALTFSGNTATAVYSFISETELPLAANVFITAFDQSGKIIAVKYKRTMAVKGTSSDEISVTAKGIASAKVMILSEYNKKTPIYTVQKMK